MGIYSEIINCCTYLGHDFMGYLQTKDLEGILDLYWIAPDGCLFKVCWPPMRSDDIFDFQENTQHQKPRGTVMPFRFSGLIRLTGGGGIDSPRRPVWFLDGRLVTAHSIQW